MPQQEVLGGIIWSTTTFLMPEMPKPTPPAPFRLQSLMTLMFRYRICPENPSQGHSQGKYSTFTKFGYGGSMNQGLTTLFAANGRVLHRNPETPKVKDDRAKAPIPVPAPSSPSFSAWAKWLLGSLVSLLLPYCKKKWDNLLRLEGNLETVVEEMENVAEIVEKVAATTEKISAEAADKFPDHGKLKEAAEVVEHVSSLTAKEARQTQNFIHKIDDLKTDFQDLETMVEPLLDRVLEEKDAGK